MARTGKLTARVNDDGWDTSFSEWLKVSRLGSKDAVLIFSVGGGNREKNVSPNLVRALELAAQVKAPVFGVVGKDGDLTGYRWGVPRKRALLARERAGKT